MAHINEHFLQLQKSYLFIEIANRVKAFKAKNKNAEVISLGIGDVTQPLAESVVRAMHKAVEEMGEKDTFHGYGPEHGYDFLQDIIIEHDFRQRGINMERDDVFINDGAKSDTGNIGDILGVNNRVCMTDPIYPVYLDSNVMSGRAGNFSDGQWSNICFMPCTEENGFVADIPDHHVDLIYLCYPNNPTGTVITRNRLKEWVDYALENHSIILYDAAYEAYIQEENIPHSIYEIEGAKECAIEFHSFSKTAGFTGVRCGYTIVPQALMAYTADGEKVNLNQLWNRRQSTKYNGTSYITQKAAAAVYSEEGQIEIQETINYYMTNAKIMREALQRCNLKVFGGENAPYLWCKTPEGLSSWDFFDQMLEKVHIVCTPGVGFGPSGEGYVRLTAFGSRENTVEALYKLSTWL